MTTKVVDEENEWLNLSPEDRSLIEDLAKSPSFRLSRILRQHFDKARDKASFLDRTNQIFDFYYRVRGSRDHVNIFSARNQDVMLVMEELDRLQADFNKKSTLKAKTKRKQKLIRLENIFQEETQNLKRDFIRVITARKHQRVTKTFHEIVHFFWSSTSQFPHEASVVCQVFLTEFGNKLGNKIDTLRRGLTYKEKGDFPIPDAISKVFKKYADKLR